MSSEKLQPASTGTAPNAGSLKKVTIVPVLVDFEDTLSKQPLLHIQADLTFEDTSQILSSSAFELWKEYISAEERKRLGSITHALVHHYSGYLGSDKEDQQSREFMQHVFVCLRLVKPLRRSFQYVQATEKPEGLDVYSFSQPPLNDLPLMPVTQTLNRLTLSDTQELTQILPKFMLVSRPNGPLYLQRAIRFYEAGYSATTEPPLQLISWMIGIEAVLSKGGGQLESSELSKAVKKKYGKINIKQPQWRPYLEKSAPLLVESEFDHLIEYRNCLVHARPLPDYLRALHIDHLGRKHQLAEYLSAAAAMILQAAILQEFSQLESGTL